MKYFFKTRLGETRYLMADGSLLCEAVPVARTGSQIYPAIHIPHIEPDSDGDIDVIRTPDAVFNPASMASFEGIAVVINHPRDARGDILFIAPDNWQSLAQGHAQNIRRGTGEQADLLLADLVIKNDAAIRAIDAGLREISCGYDADYIQTGVGKAEQINIVGNHIALVPEGRAGKRCSIGDSQSMTTKNTGWFTSLRRAIKTGDSVEAEALLKNAPDNLTGDDAVETPTVILKVEAAEKTEADTPTADENETGMAARHAALETALQSILEKLTPSSTTVDETTEEEEEKDTRRLTGDAAYQQYVVARAELILPGFSLPEGAKPGTLKRQVLSTACKTTDGKALLASLTDADADFMTMPFATVDSVFNGASEIARWRNNAKQQMPAFNLAGCSNTIAELNKTKADFWKNKGATA
ncbi:hypothetical protein SGGMMB4_04215 [Sodalis glossinidius str. 'morsitans']|uniref:DUF2213 domain-containing protein n=1 Tax=Sodalis glossinidius (strain morsitans) TaxID=343509 RepID=A0A193QLN5_SODGM|nr:DUF2213 domain-containing protein [Sodalis glossinidius]CRL46008.1 hypothetical protein SGGMMB4_04215 [Sodalis glossinidius str. 'morsitans']